jgi:phosphatidylserine decarboxylase
MVKEGIPYVIVPAVIALILGALQFWTAVFVFIGIAAFMAFFFRDPHRVPPEGEGLVISAADGKVTRIDETDTGKLVSVFLSPFDVHVNRSPIGGTIRRIEYISGKKSPATANNASLVNERNALTIENDKISVVCTQIAGILARRIVCWKTEGDKLKMGERFGLIKFSSRTDIKMPVNVELMVKIGDRVRGGETIIARVV